MLTFDEYMAVLDAARDEKERITLAALDHQRGGLVQCGRFRLIVSRSTAPDRDVYPWRVTIIDPDGRPSGHTVHKAFYVPGESSVYPRGAVNEVIKWMPATPAEEAAAIDALHTVDATPQPAPQEASPPPPQPAAPCAR